MLSRLLCLLLIIGSTTTQIQTIAVGSVRLSLGMPKNTVISQLSPEFIVRDLESEGGPPGLTVLAKAGPPFHYVAHISFKSDRLVEVIRDWSPDDQQKGVETGEALYGLIASFVQEGNQDCALRVNDVHEPGFEGKAAFIVCGKKYIKVTLSHSSQYGDAVILGEVLARDSK